MHFHGHDHDDGHGHAPVRRDFGRMFALATLLNVGLVAIQVVFGVLSHSTALLADAGHNFGDAFGLLLAWGAHGLSRQRPTEQFTYGFRSSSILASLLNAVILLVATGAIAWEAIQRLFEPQPVAGGTVMVVAALAIVLNGLAAWLLVAGKGDLNVRGAFLHMIADAGVSFGVVVAGGAILLTGWNWIDPAVSLVISGVIVWGTWGLLQESVTMTLQAVPAGIEPAKVKAYLEELPGVAGIHDLHIWPMSTTETALTCHLVMPVAGDTDAFIASLCEELHARFRIEHATLQIERNSAECRLAPDHVV
jgi:cobalt-zinc-cadmium efflux system protein